MALKIDFHMHTTVSDGTDTPAEILHKVADLGIGAFAVTDHDAEAGCGQILEMLEQRPELLPQLRTFLRYYLPTTLKLLDARARLDDAGTPKGREVRRRISNALGEVDKAFRNQIEALEEYRFVDLESEMDVLSQMLRSDGLISDEYEEKGQTMASGGH